MQYIIPPLARKIVKRGFLFAATCAIALAVSACSGGGGSSPNPLPPSNPAAPASPTPTPVPSVAAPATVPPAPPSSSAPSSLVYISDLNSNQILAYPTHTGGTVAPVKTIGGSQTQLNSPEYLAFDTRGNLYVVNRPIVDVPGTGSVAEQNQSINVYPPHANGNVAPVRVISGANTGLASGYFVAGLAVDSSGNVYVSIQNEAETCPTVGPTFTPCTNNGDATIAIFAPNANGNVAPTLAINSDACWLAAGLAITSTGALSVSCAPPIRFAPGSEARRAPSARRRIETDPGLGQIVTFAPGASGNATAVSTISGSNPGINDSTDRFALSPLGTFYVGIYTIRNNVLGFPQNGNGSIPPTIDLDGTDILNFALQGLTVGPDGTLYVSQGTGPSTPCILEYSSTANGMDPPIYQILSPATSSCPLSDGIAVGPP